MRSQRRLRWRAAPALFLWLALAAPPPVLFAAAPMLRLARPDAVSERPDPAPGRAVVAATPRPPVPPAAPPDPPPPRF